MSNIWCTHKAYIRGLLIQLASRERKRRLQLIENLLAKIQTFETHHKQIHDPSSLTDLTNCRHELRLLMLSDHEKQTQRLKAKYYSQVNKAGKLLANHLKAHHTKNSIAYLLKPGTNSKIFHPKDIANSFREY